MPEEPDTDDEALIRKWKWKVKSVKKENGERHSQRCDTELKLTVRNSLCMLVNLLSSYCQMPFHLTLIHEIYKPCVRWHGK